MKKGKRIWILVILLEVLLCVALNLLLLKLEKTSGREYRVEVVRTVREIEAGEMPAVSGKTYVKSIQLFDRPDGSNRDYAVAEAPDGQLYRIGYETGNRQNTAAFWIVNGCWLLSLLITLGIAIYLDRKVFRPFRDISELPVEIARGNLSVPVKEEKNRYFGKFLWGMDMLRENIEDGRQRNLELEREKKMMILSLSHDIKTPISAIRLYNKALSEGLYEDEAKRQEAYAGIERNTALLEDYIEDIRRTTKEDFLQLSVKDGEWYLSEVMNKVEELYREKTAKKRTGFTVEPYEECLLKGDPARALEVLQNLLENALKYGDGREIRLSFADEEDCRLVTVMSTGASLPEQEMVNIFDSFYRGSNAKDAPGSGMGLYICRSIMNAMDGDIFAEEREDAFYVTAVFRKK